MRTRSILGLALALRLAVIALFLSHHPPTWLYTRAPELASLASSLVHGHGLNSPFGGDTGPSAFLAPGYPAIIALVFELFGDRSAASVLAIFTLQTGFALLTVLATMLVSRSLFGTSVANIAGMIGAVGLPLLWVPVIFWETSLSTLLLTGLVALALRCQQKPSAGVWAILGLSGGIALLVNPSLALAIIAILSWAAYQSRSAPFRRPALAFLIMLAVFAPWPIRNALALHHFIPFRSNFGFELYMGNRAGGNGDFDERLFPIENQQEHAKYAAKGELPYMQEKSALGKAFIQAHPAKFLATSARRVVWFWSGAGGKPDAWLGVAYASTTTLFGFIGLVLLANRLRAVAVLFLLPLVLFSLPYYIVHADLRFRLVLDPLLIILSAYAMVRIAEYLKSVGWIAASEAPNQLLFQSAPALLTESRLSRRSAGQSLIEVALFLPIFVTLICYAVDFGYFFLVAASLDSAARNAAEYSVQGTASTAQAAEPSAAVVSSLAIASIGLSSATASTVSVRLCSSSVGVNSAGNTTRCTTPATGAGAISATADTDPESPTFLLNRVDVAYTVTPPVPMPAAIFPTLTFHRMVEIRSIQ